VTSDNAIDQLTEAWTAITRAATSPAFAERIEERSGVALRRSAIITLWRLVTDGPQRISELADGVGVDVSTMSRLVRQLEREGLVERGRSEDDLRSVQIRPAPAGLDAYARISAARMGVLNEVIAGWPQADRDALVSLLQRFAQDLVAHVTRTEAAVAG